MLGCLADNLKVADNNILHHVRYQKGCFTLFSIKIDVMGFYQ